MSAQPVQLGANSLRIKDIAYDACHMLAVVTP